MKNTLSRRTARDAVAALGTVALMVALTACGGGTGPASDAAGPTVVRIPTLPGLGTYPLRVAEEQGFFEDHGIDVELTVAASSADFVPGLGRQYDVIVPTVSDLIQGSAQGADVRALAGLVQTTYANPNSPLVTTAESGPIESAEDLVGHTIAVPALTTTAATSIRWLLEEAGYSQDAATLVAVPLPSMADQLTAGLITAAVMPTPFSATAVAQGFVAGIDPIVAAGGDPSPVVILATSQEWFDENPEVAEGVYAAISDAIAWIENNYNEAIAGVAAWLQIPPSALEGVPFPPLSPDITLEEIATWVDILSDTDVVTAPVAPVDLIVIR